MGPFSGTQCSKLFAMLRYLINSCFIIIIIIIIMNRRLVPHTGIKYVSSMITMIMCTATSGGARVFAARDKRLCCRPPPSGVFTGM